MLKCFCDICQKEIDYENRIDVTGWLKVKGHAYCIDCFQKPKNWEIIHLGIQKTQTPKNLAIAS